MGPSFPRCFLNLQSSSLPAAVPFLIAADLAQAAVQTLPTFDGSGNLVWSLEFGQVGCLIFFEAKTHADYFSLVINLKSSCTSKTFAFHLCPLGFWFSLRSALLQILLLSSIAERGERQNCTAALSIQSDDVFVCVQSIHAYTVYT